jgi:anti-anti-sigma factor
LLDAFALTTEAPSVVIDLSETDYIDSVILECIMAMRKATLGRGARLVLTGMHGTVERLFELCQLSSLFELRDRLSAVLDGAVEAGRVSNLTLVARPTEEADPA